MEGPPLGPGGEDITWPDQVAPRGRKASSTRKIKPQTSNLKSFYYLLWFQIVTVSEFSCLAKSFSESVLTPMPQIPNQLHFIQKSAYEVLGAILEA